MSETTNRAVFLSYASQDAEAARRICETLRASGVEVWFDADGGLEHGDEWDAKIRKQIKECVLFIPIISANTQARHEGYFRIEWELAAQRAMGIASGVAFILPVVIDDTREPEALVPDRFKAVQWTKLPGGVLTPEVKARYLKLWSHRIGAGRATIPLAAETGSGDRALPPPRRRVLATAWLAAVVVTGAAIGCFVAFRPKSAERAARPSASPGVSPAGGPSLEKRAPVSEARQLVAKAWTLLDLPEMGRAELNTADALCKRAAAVDPTDAEVWAAWTHVHTWLVFHNFDRSNARYEAAADCAARAMRLDPSGYEARLAQAFQWVRGLRQTPPALTEESRTLLRQLLAERPDEPRALFALGFSLLKKAPTRRVEGIEALERLAKNPAFAALASMEIGWEYRFRGEFAKAEEAADRSIAAKPYWNNLGLKIALALEWRGDTTLALDTLKRLPPAVLQEDFGIGFADWVYDWAGKQNERLAFLNGIPKEWLNSQMYIGPRAYLVGRTRLALGQKEAAERELRRALEMIEQRLEPQPNDATLLSLKGHTLHFLGAHADGEKAYRLARQINRQANWISAWFEAPDAMFAELERAYERKLYWPTAASLRLNPDWAALRELPRFEALQARLDADPRTSPTAGAVTSARAAGTPDPKSVAVLAFANLSGNKDDEAFSDGISDELRAVLSEIPGLKVVPRASAFSFKGRNVPIPEIAKLLGVAYVVDGSVRKSGPQVRIGVQLIKATDGFPAWSESFRPDLKDIFATQDEIARHVARTLQLRIDTDAQSHGITKNPDAYEAYLKGRQIYNAAATTDYRAAIDLLLRATQLDPNFALAHGALAEAYTTQGNVEAEPAAKMFPLARAAAERALAIDARNVQAYTALGEIAFHFDWDYEKSDEFLQRAIVVDPNYAGAHGRLAGHYNARGRHEESLAEIRRAKEIDPLDSTIGPAWTLIFMKRYPEAVAAAREQIASHPDSSFVHIGLGLALFEHGKTEEALRVFEGLVAKVGDHPLGLTMLGWTYGRMGKTAQGRAVLERMNILAKSRHISALWLAMVASGLGDLELAFAHIDRAFELRDPHLPDYALGPIFAPLQSDPRYRTMLQRLKLARYFPEPVKK